MKSFIFVSALVGISLSSASAQDATPSAPPVPKNYQETKDKNWIRNWIYNIFKNKSVPGIELIFEKENIFLTSPKYYGPFGKGRRTHDPRTFDGRVGGLGTIMETAIYTAIPGSNLIRRFEKLFDTVAIPLFDRHFPELRTDPKYAALYDKILRETMRNVLLVEWTADIHRSRAPDMANLWFGLSHPVYDGMMDTEIDEGPNAPQYSTPEKLVRATRIIMRDYNIDGPLLKMEKILIEIVKGLEESIPPQNTEIFFDELFKLNAAQLESIRQQLPGITAENLRLITFRKGAYSARLYALLADHHFTQFELDTFFLEGAFLQNLDDMSDVEEDAQEGGMTLVVQRKIVPEELWAMTKIWFDRLDDYVLQGVYDADMVAQYFSVIETFLISATKKYQSNMKRADLIASCLAENQPIPPPDPPSTSSQIISTAGDIVFWPFAKITQWALPMAKYVK